MSSNILIHENYQDYIGPVSGLMGFNPKGWLETEHHFDSPQATHHMLYDYDSLPPFMGVHTQASRRVDAFFASGFRPVAGILVGEMTVRQAVRLHERGEEMIETGGLVGPYFMDNQLMNGIKIYTRVEQ